MNYQSVLVLTVRDPASQPETASSRRHSNISPRQPPCRGELRLWPQRSSHLVHPGHRSSLQHHHGDSGSRSDYSALALQVPPISTNSHFCSRPAPCGIPAQHPRTSASSLSLLQHHFRSSVRQVHVLHSRYRDWLILPGRSSSHPRRHRRNLLRRIRPDIEFSENSAGSPRK